MVKNRELCRLYDKNGDESGKIKNTSWDDGYLLWITIGVILIVYSGDRNIYKKMKKKTNESRKIRVL